MKLVITGANSSVGRNLLQHIAAREDVTAIAGVRSQQAADSLPQAANIEPAVISYEDIDGLHRSLEAADSVIHLAGVLFETAQASYQRANVDSTAAVVEAARKAGVGHLVLISVLGAAADSDNAYYRSKGEAERRVIGSGLPASVIRTPMLLGAETAGGQALVTTAAAGRARLLGGGRHRVRPLDVDDLSRAILRTCQYPPDQPVTHELIGPEALDFAQLVERTAAMMEKRVTITSVPIWLVRLFAGMRHLFRRRGLSPDIVDVITSSEEVTRNADHELGITLTPLPQTLAKLVEEPSHDGGE